MNELFTISVKPKEKGVLFLFLAALLPLLFTGLWLFKNTQLPTSDATDYLGTAVNIYREFLTQGFWQGLLHLPHGWRPIFFPLLSLPFLFLSHGNVFFAYNSVSILCVLVSVSYVYLLFRLQLDKIPSLLAANLICLLPLMQGPVLAFFAESALFPCLMASLYHLIQSDYLRNKKHTFAFIAFFTLAIVIRPVEAIAHFAFILILFCSQGWYRGFFSMKQITTLFASAASALFLFFLINALHLLDHSGFHPIDGGYFDQLLIKTLYHALLISTVLVIASWSLVMVVNRFSASSYYPIPRSSLITTFLFVIFLSMVWFLPNAFNTFLWIFRTSIGDVALASTPRNHSFLPLLQRFTAAESEIVVIGITVLSSISLLLLSERERHSILSSNVFLYLFMLIPFPVWEVLQTVQSTSRKLSIAFSALLMVMLLFGLQRGRLYKIRLTVLIALLLLQFLFAISFVFPNPAFSKLSLGGYPQPITIQPNPHDVVIRFLSEQEKIYQFHNVGVEANVEQGSVVDTFLLILLGQITEQPFSIGYPYFSNYSLDNPKKLSEKTDAIFLADKLSEMTVSSTAAYAYGKKYMDESNPTLKTLYQFLLAYSQNKLADMGWKLGPCIVIKAADQNNYLSCLLLSNKKYANINSMRMNSST